MNFLTIRGQYCPQIYTLTTMIGGTIATVCSRCQSRRNLQFAMDTRSGYFARCCFPLLREARQPFAVRGDRKTRRVHYHGEVSVVPVDAGDIQHTDFAKTLYRSIVRRV